MGGEVYRRSGVDLTKKFSLSFSMIGGTNFIPYGEWCGSHQSFGSQGTRGDRRKNRGTRDQRIPKTETGVLETCTTSDGSYESGTEEDDQSLPKG